ncbi:RNA polymerase sigma factor [Cellulomonas sp. McL0617]|uniref:RNA polymerase sigma factor n=1 Tax=Cellulomonas sp. McL0617 TaxID=3415675 RepID=UPI003CECDBFC
MPITTGVDARTDRDLWLSEDRDDAPAFGTLFDRHHRAVHRYCFRLTGSRVAAEDLLTEAFLQAWRRRDEITPLGDDALPVLLSLATACLPRGRRLIPTQRRPPEADEVAMRDVLRRIAHVRGRHREILELHAFGGLSDEQIADVLGVQASSVRWSLDRTRGPLEEPVVAS